VQDAIITDSQMSALSATASLEEIANGLETFGSKQRVRVSDTQINNNTTNH